MWLFIFQKWNSNLGWQSQHRLSKPLDFSYKVFLFFPLQGHNWNDLLFGCVSQCGQHTFLEAYISNRWYCVRICTFVHSIHPWKCKAYFRQSFFIRAFCVLHFSAENDVFYKFHSNKHEGNFLVAVGPLNRYLVIREDGEDILKMFEWLPKMHILI